MIFVIGPEGNRLHSYVPANLKVSLDTAVIRRYPAGRNCAARLPCRQKQGLRAISQVARTYQRLRAQQTLKQLVLIGVVPRWPLKRSQ